MTIIRITKQQIAKANQAREAALIKNEDFRRFDELRQRLMREAASLHRDVAAPEKE